MIRFVLILNMSDKEFSDEGQKSSEDDFVEFMAICLDEGWSPTKCPEGCVVEPDGKCPHEFLSVALEYGFI